MIDPIAKRFDTRGLFCHQNLQKQGEQIFQKDLLEAMAEGNMLQVIFFAVMLGVALLR